MALCIWGDAERCSVHEIHRVKPRETPLTRLQRPHRLGTHCLVGSVGEKAYAMPGAITGKVIVKSLWGSVIPCVCHFCYSSFLLTFASLISLLSLMWTRHSCFRTFTLADYPAWETLALDFCLANCVTFFIPLLRFYLQSLLALLTFLKILTCSCPI